jgi:hypothetical protein
LSWLRVQQVYKQGEKDAAAAKQTRVQYFNANSTKTNKHRTKAGHSSGVVADTSGRARVGARTKYKNKNKRGCVGDAVLFRSRFF